MALPRIAVLSDIHANLEAFLAVLEDMRTVTQPEIVVNLGDTIGYGPDPAPCIDLAIGACDVNLCGNHDYAVVNEAEGFNPVARAAVDYHRSLLRPFGHPSDDPDRHRRWQWLLGLDPMRCLSDEEDGDVEFMHASPRQPISEYVLPTDPELDPDKIDILFSAMSGRVAFIGHTHFPGVIEEGAGDFWMPDMLGVDGYTVIGGKRALVNVGSVGQPRDRDPRACYVIFDQGRVEYRRIEYDLAQTQRKIRDTGKIHELCASRLADGR